MTPTFNAAAELINNAKLAADANNKVTFLTQVAELAINKDPSILNDILPQVLLFQTEKQAVVRRYVCTFASDALKAPGNFTGDTLEQTATCLAALVREDNANVVKAAVSAWGVLLRATLAAHAAHTEDAAYVTAWQDAFEGGTAAVTLGLQHENEGVRITAFRLIESMVLLYSDNVAPQLPGPTTPASLPLPSPAQLAKEAERLLRLLLEFLKLPNLETVSGVLMVGVIKCLKNIATKRKEWVGRILPDMMALTNGTPALLQTQHRIPSEIPGGKPTLCSIGQQLKVTLTAISKTRFDTVSVWQPRIRKALNHLESSMALNSKDGAAGNKSRPRPDGDNAGQSNKRARTEKDADAGTNKSEGDTPPVDKAKLLLVRKEVYNLIQTNPGPAIIDQLIETLGPVMLAEVVIANLAFLPSKPPEEEEVKKPAASSAASQPKAEVPAGPNQSTASTSAAAGAAGPASIQQEEQPPPKPPKPVRRAPPALPPLQPAALSTEELRSLRHMAVQRLLNANAATVQVFRKPLLARLASKAPTSDGIADIVLENIMEDYKGRGGHELVMSWLFSLFITHCGAKVDAPTAALDTPVAMEVDGEEREGRDQKEDGNEGREENANAGEGEQDAGAQEEREEKRDEQSEDNKRQAAAVSSSGVEAADGGGEGEREKGSGGVESETVSEGGGKEATARGGETKTVSTREETDKGSGGEENEVTVSTREEKEEKKEKEENDKEGGKVCIGAEGEGDENRADVRSEAVNAVDAEAGTEGGEPSTSGKDKGTPAADGKGEAMDIDEKTKKPSLTAPHAPAPAADTSLTEQPPTTALEPGGAPDLSGTPYEEVLLAVLEGLREQLPPKDKSLTNILLEAPALPMPKVCIFLRDVMRQGGDWATLALSSARDVLMQRPPSRTHVLKLVLEATVDEDNDTRDKAVRLVTNQLFVESNLQQDIHDFALKQLHLLPKRDAPCTNDTQEVGGATGSREEEKREQNAAAGSREAPKREEDAAGGGREGQGREQQTAPGRKDSAAGVKDEGGVRDQGGAGPSGGHTESERARAAQLCGLYMSLCTRSHAMLPELLKAYATATPAAQAAMDTSAEPLAGAVGYSPYFIKLVQSPPPGSLPLLVHMLHVLGEKALPPPPLLTACMDLVKKDNQLEVAAAVLPALPQSEVVRLLPRLLRALPPAIMIRTLKRLTASPPTPALLSPAEVLQALLVLDGTKEGISTRAHMGVLDGIIQMQGVFTREAVAQAIQQVEDATPLPQLFMRSVIQALFVHPKLKDFVLGLLSRLITRHIWTMESQWPGFLIIMQRFVPHTFSVFLQLPPQVLEDTLLVKPMTRHMQDFAIKLARYVKGPVCEPKPLRAVVDIMDAVLARMAPPPPPSTQTSLKEEALAAAAAAATGSPARHTSSRMKEEDRGRVRPSEKGPDPGRRRSRSPGANGSRL